MQPCSHAASTLHHAAMLPCSQTIIYENLTTNCKCMLSHCTSKSTGGLAKTFMAIRSGCQEKQDLQDEVTNPEVGGRISRSATNGTTSSHRQKQQSQLYQQLAEHEEHYAKTMTNSAIRNLFPDQQVCLRPLRVCRMHLEGAQQGTRRQSEVHRVRAELLRRHRDE